MQLPQQRLSMMRWPKLSSINSAAVIQAATIQAVMIQYTMIQSTIILAGRYNPVPAMLIQSWIAHSQLNQFWNSHKDCHPFSPFYNVQNNFTNLL